MKKKIKNENPGYTFMKFPENQMSILAFALKSISECVSITDMDDRVIFINESFIKTYGYSEDELVDKPISIVRSPNNSPEIVREILPATKRGGWRGELMNRRKDGSDFPVSLATSIIYDDNEQAIAIMGVASDISERKKVEDALRESERYARALLDAIPDLMFRLDRTGTYLDYKAGIEDLYFQSETIIGKRNRDMTPPEFADLIEEKIHSTLEKGVMEVFEYKLPVTNRGIRIYEARMVASGQDEVTAISRDITDRKKADEALRESEKLLRESQIIAGLGSYVLDISSGQWRSSGVLDKIFGINKTYDHSIENWEALIHKDHRQEMSKYFNDEVLKKQIRFDKEYKIIRNNDKVERWVHGLGKLEVDDQGHLVKMVGTVQDITEQKQIQEEIKKLNNELEDRVFERTVQLEAANKELEAFSYSVSHDLHAPIRAIRGFTQILIKNYQSKLDEDGKEICAIIQESAVHMGQLVDDLLKFSQFNRIDIKFSAIDMKYLCNAIYIELTTPETRQKIDFQIETLHPAWGDQTLIRQVWTNLISNALKFSSYCSNVIINISSKEQKGYTVYCIKDNGAGFDMNYMDKLFGVFQRLHSVKEFEGNGVGLAIVQRIIYRHGGKVWAEGEINKGASFYFKLPIKG